MSIATCLTCGSSPVIRFWDPLPSVSCQGRHAVLYLWPSRCYSYKFVLQQHFNPSSSKAEMLRRNIRTRPAYHYRHLPKSKSSICSRPKAMTAWVLFWGPLRSHSPTWSVLTTASTDAPGSTSVWLTSQCLLHGLTGYLPWFHGRCLTRVRLPHRSSHCHYSPRFRPQCRQPRYLLLFNLHSRKDGYHHTHAGCVCKPNWKIHCLSLNCVRLALFYMLARCISALTRYCCFTIYSAKCFLNYALVL